MFYGNRPMPTMEMPISVHYFDVLQLDSDRFAFCGGYNVSGSNFAVYVYSRSHPGQYYYYYLQLCRCFHKVKVEAKKICPYGDMAAK